MTRRHGDRRGPLRQVRARLGRVPAAVWAITALHVALLTMWAQLTPIDQAPDEAAHASLVRRLTDGRPYPDYDTFHPSTAAMRSSLVHRPGVATRGGPLWLTPENAPPSGERASADDLGGLQPWAHANQISQHPPLYYAIAVPVLKAKRAVLGEGGPIERGRIVLRLFNVALIAPLPLLAWATARRIGAGQGAAATAATFPLAVPQLSHIGSSINNDGLLILLGGLLSVGVATIARGDDRCRTAVAAGVVTGLALWTKAHAFAFVPWLVIAYAAPLWHDRGRWRRQTGAAAIAVGTALATGSWWWVRNLIRHGELSPSILSGAFPAPPDFEPRLPGYLADNVPRFAQRFWGSFGSFVAPVTPALVVAATVITVGACVAAFAPARTPRLAPPTTRSRLAALAAVVPGLAVLVAVNAWGYYRDSGIEAAVQGRYLFGALVPLAVVAAVGIARVMGREAPLVVLGGAIVLQVDGIRAALRAFWAEPDASLWRSAEAARAWSPLPDSIATVTGLLVAALLAASLARLWRDRSDRSGRPAAG